MDQRKIEALAAYFSQPWANPTTQGNPDLVFPNAITLQQSRWLGLGCEIAIADGIPNLELAQKLRRQRAGLEIILKSKKLELPDENAWRHPELPFGAKETYERYLLAYPRENRAEMTKGGKGSQTGEGKKKVRKWGKMSPKPVKIRS